MNKIYIPEGYKPVLGSYDLQRAIALCKEIFQQEFTENLQLKRVSAPLFVRAASGLNDDLNGGEGPVSFEIPAKKFKVSGNLSDVPAAFELTNIFLVYANREQTFIIPTRCMSKAQIKELREILSHGIGERFYTMFGRKGRK